MIINTKCISSIQTELYVLHAGDPNDKNNLNTDLFKMKHTVMEMKMLNSYEM